MNKILDLRFVIGLFFLIVGVLLIGYSFMSNNESGEAINRWCGTILGLFGVFMIILSFAKNADDEFSPTDQANK